MLNRLIINWTKSKSSAWVNFRVGRALWILSSQLGTPLASMIQYIHAYFYINGDPVEFISSIIFNSLQSSGFFVNFLDHYLPDWPLVTGWSLVQPTFVSHHIPKALWLVHQCFSSVSTIFNVLSVTFEDAVEMIAPEMICCDFKSAWTRPGHDL